MKRKLLILSILFLILWVACLFYPGHNNGIHIALIVELVFLMNYLLIKKIPAVKETTKSAVINQPIREAESVSVE
jgi:hypothetical protein